MHAYTLCIAPYKLTSFEIFTFSSIISVDFFQRLWAKLRNQKLSKMTFQVEFRAKNVPRLSFWLLVEPKLKQGGIIIPLGHNVFPEPGLIALNKFFLNAIFFLSCLVLSLKHLISLEIFFIDRVKIQY